jgi:four helix bundle protein
MDRATVEAKRKVRKGQELAMRLERFAGGVVRVSEALPSTRSGKHIQDQLLRAGTAVGAHYAEAQGAQSRKDFLYKLSVALKEAGEARYWMGVALHARDEDNPEINALMCEATELIAILQAAQSTARAHDRDPRGAPHPES